ncbi:MAG: beta-lactamase family protein [Acidobacteria bacterium]|nr:beta-lactamase family protein [Acidobacteriota bacterium]
MRLTAVIGAVALVALQPTLAGRDERATRVEQALRGPNVIKGRAPRLHTLAERMATLKVPGVSVAVVDDGRIAWARGYGDTGDGSRVTPETLFQAASLSKAVAAMVALRLVELGRLSLDEDVNARLTSWQVPPSAAAEGVPVTLRRLLSHTAGLTVSGFPGYAVDAPVPSLVQLLGGAAPANTAPIRIDTKPGTTYRYSGGGYQVVQLLIEDVTRRPFAEVARELVLDPLGMTHSTFQQPLTGPRLAGSAAGHDGDGAIIPGKRHTYPELTAAGLWTTPSDYAQVILEVQQPRRVLRRATADTMLTPVLDGYGLGFGVQETDGQASFSHGGSNRGFKCVVRGYRGRPRGAVVMTNSDNGSRLANEVMRAVAVEYDWPDFKPRERTVVTVPLDTLRTYEGRYTQDGLDAIIAIRGAELTISGPGQPVLTLLATSSTEFFHETGAVPDVTFAKTADGRMQLAAGSRVAIR